MAWVAVLLSVGSGVARAQQTGPCAASPEVATALEQLPVRSIDETSWEFQQKRLSALQALRSRYPGDMFVQRDYIALLRQTDLAQVSQEYKALYERAPDDRNWVSRDDPPLVVSGILLRMAAATA